MQLHHSDDVETYAGAVTAFLESEPVRRNLLRTVVESLRGGAAAMTAPASFWWITDAGAVVGAASWTPPHPLLVSDLPAASVAGLVEGSRRRGDDIGVPVPGVIGPTASARQVAGAWERLTGTPAAVHMVEILHQLTTLVEPVSPPGRWRRAGAADVDVVAAWFVAFAEEAGVVHVPNRERFIAHVIEAGRCYLWEVDGPPVSMVCHNVAVASVVRVGPVYTPPRLRMRGYARRLTYEVTRQAIADGARTTVLYTDAANPGSNSIYRQVGYRPVEEHVHLTFEG